VSNKYKASGSKPKTIIIHCSDPRFEIAFYGFITEELKLSQGEFIPIVVGGGPATFAHQKTKCNDFNYLLSQILFFLEHFTLIERMVVINHQDCGYYKTITGCQGQEKNDIPKIVETLEVLLPHIKIESYYASFSEETCVEIIFESV
jgi:carbonic anhydrase